jgi:hypothetical protein
VIVALVDFVWPVIAVIVEFRRAADTSIGRAIGIALFSYVMIFVFSVILSAIRRSVAAI